MPIEGGLLMVRLSVNMPCGKELCFFLHEDQKVHCNNPQVLGALSDRGIQHINGSRYYPNDGEIFLEALHDFYWLKGLLVRVA